MRLPVGLTPRSNDRLSLDSGAISCAAQTETVLKSVHLRGNCHAYLDSLAYDAEAGATSYIEFRAYLGGTRVPRWWATRKATLGQIGAPMSIGEELANGTDFEIRAYNSHATDAYEAYSDGEVAFYDETLR